MKLPTRPLGLQLYEIQAKSRAGYQGWGHRTRAEHGALQGVFSHARPTRAHGHLRPGSPHLADEEASLKSAK